MRMRSGDRAGCEAAETPPDIGGATDGLWAAPSDCRTVVEEVRGWGPNGRRLDRVDVDRASSGLSSCAFGKRHWAFAVRDWVLMGMVWLAATVGWYACALLLSMPEYQAFQWKAVGFTYALVVVLITVVLNGLDEAATVLRWTAVGIPALWSVATLSVFASPFWGPPVVCAAPLVLGRLGSPA